MTTTIETRIVRTAPGMEFDVSVAGDPSRPLVLMLHGFCVIEAAGGFGLPEDLDETFRQLIHIFTQSLGRKS